jgi:hypothetical protein
METPALPFPFLNHSANILMVVDLHAFPLFQLALHLFPFLFPQITLVNHVFLFLRKPYTRFRLCYPLVVFWFHFEG